MSCELAMIKKVISIDENQTISDVLTIFQDKGIRGVPVVDSENRVVGVFSFKTLLKMLLPEAAVLEDQPRLKKVDVSLAGIHGTMHWVVERLERLKDKPVKDFMVSPRMAVLDTPLREGVRLLEKHGSPVPVVDGMETKKLVGVITSQSVIKALNAALENSKAA